MDEIEAVVPVRSMRRRADGLVSKSISCGLAWSSEPASIDGSTMELK